MKTLNKLIPLIFALLLFNCKQEESNKQSKENQDSLNFREFLASIPEKEINTIKIYPSNYPDSINYKFKGLPIKNKYKSIFNLPENENFYVCFKYRIKNDRIGIVARTRGEYIDNSINLYVFDLSNQTLITQIDLADSWADAGEFFESNSWISDFDTDKIKDILMITNFSAPTDNYDSINQYDSVYYYKLNENSFELKNKSRVDSTRYIEFLKIRLEE